MNERIFELAKQADIIQWDTLPSGARTPDHESVVKAKKFAELILKECFQCLTAEAERLYALQNDDADGFRLAENCYDNIQHLKDKFGIE